MNKTFKLVDKNSKSKVIVIVSTSKDNELNVSIKQARSGGVNHWQTGDKEALLKQFSPELFELNKLSGVNVLTGVNPWKQTNINYFFERTAATLGKHVVTKEQHEENLRTLEKALENHPLFELTRKHGEHNGIHTNLIEYINKYDDHSYRDFSKSADHWIEQINNNRGWLTMMQKDRMIKKIREFFKDLTEYQTERKVYDRNKHKYTAKNDYWDITRLSAYTGLEAADLMPVFFKPHGEYERAIEGVKILMSENNANKLAVLSNKLELGL